MMKVAVVIVNWNLKEDTLECLSSLSRLKLADMELVTIIVDNGSNDGSAAAFRAKFPKVKVIENKKNLGFTGGNNIGIDYVLKDQVDYVWLLNNDTVVDKSALFFLLSVFKDDRVGIAGSKIYFYRGREFHRERYQPSQQGKVIWYAGGLIDWRNMYATHRGVDAVDQGQFDEIIETEFVTGCSMLISDKVFQTIGKLDERFFLYLEDLDFCLRAKRAGFKLVYVPQAVVWHKNAGSTGRAGNLLHQYYLTRNRLLIGMRYAPPRTKLALIREAARFLVGPNIKRQAVIDAVFGRWGERYLWKMETQR